MVDSTNDFLAPNVLLIPKANTTEGASAPGDIKLSGSKLVFYTGSRWELVTSA